MTNRECAATWPNWVDLVIVFLTLRACYSGYERGCVPEAFSAVGLVSASALACNFQPIVSQEALPWWRFDPAVAQLGIFLILFIVGLVVLVRIVARTLARLITWESSSWVVRVLGLLFGAARGAWLAGMVVLLGVSSGSSYAARSIEERSVIGPALVAGMRRSLDGVRVWYPGDRLATPAVPIRSPDASSPRTPRNAAHHGADS